MQSCKGLRVRGFVSDSHKDVLCVVNGPADPEGSFANSFRMLIEGEEILLDFCIYSEKTSKAQVVSRVRIPAAFLDTIHEKIGRSFKRLSSDGVLLFPMTPDSLIQEN